MNSPFPHTHIYTRAAPKIFEIFKYFDDSRKKFKRLFSRHEYTQTHKISLFFFFFFSFNPPLPPSFLFKCLSSFSLALCPPSPSYPSYISFQKNKKKKGLFIDFPSFPPPIHLTSLFRNRKKEKRSIHRFLEFLSSHPSYIFFQKQNKKGLFIDFPSFPPPIHRTSLFRKNKNLFIDFSSFLSSIHRTSLFRKKKEKKKVYSSISQVFFPPSLIDIYEFF